MKKPKTKSNIEKSAEEVMKGRRKKYIDIPYVLERTPQKTKKQIEVDHDGFMFSFDNQVVLVQILIEDHTKDEPVIKLLSAHPMFPNQKGEINLYLLCKAWLQTCKQYPEHKVTARMIGYLSKESLGECSLEKMKLTMVN